jgi:hypothetical protein
LDAFLASDMLDTLLTAEDIRVRLRVSRSQAYALMRTMPHLRIGGSVRVAEVDFMNWLETKKEDGT